MVSTKSPQPKSPPSTHKVRSPRSPRSPRHKAIPTEAFTPLSSVLADEPMVIDPPSSTTVTSAASPPLDLRLRRVISGGTDGSTSVSTNLATPTTGSVPMSPSSTGVRTPRPRKAPLKSDADSMDIDGKKEKDGGHQLASEMDGLQVQSPSNGNGTLPTSALGISQVSAGDFPLPQKQTQPSSLSSNSTSGHDRSYSSSTDSTSTSSVNHSIIPPHFGSSYGAEGFPVHPMYSRSPEGSPAAYATQGGGPELGHVIGHGNGNSSSTSNGGGIDPDLAARQAAVLAKADEAVRQLNNTATLFQGPSTPGLPQYDPSFQIPRNYANFVTPHQPNPAVTRQSSTSSSTTDAASTSSEESDWCIPTIEWVPTNPTSPGVQHSPYLHSPGTMFAQRERDRAASASAGKMPPPSLAGKGVSSPRRTSGASTNGHLEAPPLQHVQSGGLPVGASAATPSGLRQSSALPSGVAADTVDDDDDDATVGQGRDRSPSTSSQSAQSGLDLLWRAAHGIAQPAPYDASFEHKGKRKAGAEAVDKWRSSGIPTGVGAPPSAGEHREVKVEKPSNTGLPRKRRRSEAQMEVIDPSLRREGYADEDEEAAMGDEAGGEADEAARESTGSEYQSASPSEENGSDDESEYHTGRPRGRQSGGATRGRISGGSRRVGAAGGAVRGKGGAVMNAASAPGGVTRGGTIKKVRKVGDSPSGGSKGGRKGSVTGSVPAGGVQCEYVNPLPPYNRCTDVFTRKYDLPRHMARHARREGELVYEGKLTEDKAILWRTIKDKPKVTCQSCGESFTRMDALKRHQAKQHHH
ncbi:hypothetical protein IAR55_005098 [Kwoniella newhampshirensis]|uniref:C2H2-type domain-containing protein n=1 Tax=Kwoniella newhampshirensis TaxID=1651941 RepID=A0AAW0YIV0_9TREE